MAAEKHSSDKERLICKNADANLPLKDPERGKPEQLGDKSARQGATKKTRTTSQPPQNEDSELRDIRRLHRSKEKTTKQ